MADGPVVASGYEWYLIRPLAGDLPSGWVAAADHDGTAWINEAAIECPETPDLTQLVGLGRYVALACYGSRDFRFTGVLTRPVAICDVWWDTKPTWLDDCFAGHELAANSSDGDTALDGTPVLDLRLPPAVERAAHIPQMPYDMRLRSTVVGHFDDAAAGSCRLPTEEAADDSAPPLAVLVVDCRANFVVSSIEYPTDARSVALPNPVVAYTGTEDSVDGLGNKVTRYSFDVTNPCGLLPGPVRRRSRPASLRPELGRVAHLGQYLGRGGRLGDGQRLLRLARARRSDGPVVRAAGRRRRHRRRST